MYFLLFTHVLALMPICLVSVLYDFVRFSWFLGHDFFLFYTDEPSVAGISQNFYSSSSRPFVLPCF